MKTTRALRKKLDGWKQKPIVAPGVHDPYCARIAERLGFDTLYMGGAATSMSRLGMADFGLATATEVQANARYITSVTDLPLIADSDNGYGNALNTMRTVKDYIRTGVAGIHIEDQVIPKRCGHLKGKMVVSLEEMVGKIKAAKRVIAEEDQDFVLIARTDARGAVGGGLKDAVKRLKAYRQAERISSSPTGSCQGRSSPRCAERRRPRRSSIQRPSRLGSGWRNATRWEWR
jgi:2-methylisocitrate lyase-like PEP mutase family enzyme